MQYIGINQGQNQTSHDLIQNWIQKKIGNENVFEVNRTLFHDFEIKLWGSFGEKGDEW